MKDLEKHREMVIGEPIVTAEEHAPIEMDPVADFEKARAAMEEQMHKPILRPCLAIAGFSILSMLIGMAVDQALVASRLGEPLGYGCIGVAALFAGIIWERMGVWCYGSKRIYSTKLGAGNTCKGCGDHS